ncbi:MAG: hypothetical protein ACFFDF_21590 [Candidatus Odinarchaeota archaeon]
MNQKELMFLYDIEYELENIACNSKEIDIKAKIREAKKTIEKFREDDYIEKVRRKANREINSNRPITIPNAGMKFHIPNSKEVLLSREEMEKIKPEYTEWVIKNCINEKLKYWKNVENILEEKAKECNVVLSSWEKYVV